MANKDSNDLVRKKQEAQMERTPGEIIVACRREKGWTQEELSFRCNISVSQLSRIELGKSFPQFETIEKLEEILGIELMDSFRKHRKDVNPRGRGYLKHRDALENFERQVAQRRVSGDKLNRILNDVLQAMDAEKCKSDERTSRENDVSKDEQFFSDGNQG